MTHDELVGKVVRAMCEAVGAESLDEVDLRAYKWQAIDAIATVLEEAEKICRDKQRERKDAQSCADAIKKLRGDA
jgi:hypothetical protein